jgi:hypothetical protein
MKINKTLMVTGALLVAVFVLSSYLFMGIATAVIPSNYQAVYTCPTKTGSCTAGDLACSENLGPAQTQACEYKCQPNGTWGGANHCNTNMCYGGQCDQGTIYHVLSDTSIDSGSGIFGWGNFQPA